MPGPMLRNMVMGGLDTSSKDPAILNATDFMEERLDSLDQSVLASRLAVNCAPCYVQPHLVNDLPISILNVWDDSALSDQARLFSFVYIAYFLLCVRYEVIKTLVTFYNSVTGFVLKAG